MSPLIPLRARSIDLLNLVIGKASNFLLTAILFAIASQGRDAMAFSDFGYWWSVGIMVGGVFLGGMNSAAVRTVIISSSLLPALRLSRQLVVVMLLAGMLISIILVQTGVALLDQVLLIAVVSAFGIGVMLQSLVFGLLRALEASLSNTIASSLVVFLVPTLTWLLSGPNPDLTRLFGALTAAFSISTAICIAIAWPSFRYLLNRDSLDVSDNRRILRDALAFTAINIFSYAAVNVDFTLIKRLGTEDEFVLLANAKVYFERFVLPALMVFAGAISLRVLRHPQQDPAGVARIHARFSVPFASLTFLVVAAIAIGYWVFLELFRHELHQLTWLSAIEASIGYLLFAFNAVLLDVLVLRVRIRAVLLHVFAFVVLGGAVQWIAFVTFRVAGWSLGWLAFNLVVTAFLALECLHVRFGPDKVS